jgi:hypothetical protein
MPVWRSSQILIYPASCEEPYIAYLPGSPMRALDALHIFNDQEQVGSSILFEDVKRASFIVRSSIDGASEVNSPGDPFFQ